MNISLAYQMDMVRVIGPMCMEFMKLGRGFSLKSKCRDEPRLADLQYLPIQISDC